MRRPTTAELLIGGVIGTLIAYAVILYLLATALD